MKNIYNLITDAFTSMRNEGLETDYLIEVISNDTSNFRTHVINIKSKNQNAIGSASLTLTLDLNNNLIDYEDINDLFINDNWNRFCLTFEQQIANLNTLQNYILQYINTEDIDEEDEFET